MVLSVNLVCCVCYVNYEMFRGFESTRAPKTQKTRTTQSRSTIHPKSSITTDKLQQTSIQEKTREPKVTIAPTTNVVIDNSANSLYIQSNEYFMDLSNGKQKKLRIKVKHFKKKCPENEQPLSIGTYEIPTQRDLVFFTKRTLLKMFNSYHEKTLFLLKDIREASRATVELEKKCHDKKELYKKCVKQVGKKFVTIVKELVASLKRQELEVIGLMEDRICNMTSMSTDPIQLIKTLAMDEATLDFALPAFLRLLGDCSIHCHEQPPVDHRPRLRQMTDQDLVVRHFLTRKNYVELIKDTHIYV